jgi:hypothetical protein
MRTSRNMMIENAEALRERALQRRNRGIGGGARVIALTDYAPVERGSWDELVQETAARWRHAASDALENYRFAMFGEDWSDFK